MIQKQFLFPECYVHKVVVCDDCNEVLQPTGLQYATNPPQIEFKCPKCGKLYTYRENEIKGEWKWRTI